MPIRRHKIRVLAERLLRQHRVNEPPVPVDRIAKSLGARILLRSLGDGLSGFVVRDGSRRVIGINTFHPTVRQRFTLAHEIGHMLLHDQDELHIDHPTARLRNGVSSAGVDSAEMESNLFAAELLMPRAFLEKDLKDVDVVGPLDDDFVYALADKYQVSTQALLIRLASLGHAKQ